MINIAYIGYSTPTLHANKCLGTVSGLLTLFVCLFVCLLLNGKPALFRPFVPRIACSLYKIKFKKKFKVHVYVATLTSDISKTRARFILLAASRYTDYGTAPNTEALNISL